MTKKTKKIEIFTFNKAMVFLLILMVIVILNTSFTQRETNYQLNQKKANLESEAKMVLEALSNGNTEISFTSQEGLIENKVINFNKLEYDEVKRTLGIKNDFCIFFEDITGNIVKIDNIQSGRGSDKIYINGKPCN